MERKIVYNHPNKYNKLRMINPIIYRSFITFYVFSKFKNRPGKYHVDIEIEGYDKVLEKKIKDEYKDYMKDYENKLYEKFKHILEA